jgi:RNA polymerase sigma factor (sigma-70 family)
VSPLFFKRLTDEVLGSRLACGEAAAFDELYRRYANRLAAYGAHLLGDAGLGDDVAQATMLKAYGALREGRVPNKMKPWLFRIAHNVAIDLVVRRRELPSADLPESPAGDREPYAGTLIAALATLPDRQRRAYVLREVHGLRIDETAAELGLTTAQVEQALFAARNRLAEQLVFGDRLNCVTVQRLAAGPLDAEERRALKTHLRTCASCRQTLGVRGRALSVFPAGMSLDWLPRLGAGLLGGGAPAVAKVGAVVATATIAAGGTVAVETVRSHAHRPVVPRVAAKATPVAEIEPAAQVAPAATAVLPVARPPAVAVAVSHRGSGSGSGSSGRRVRDAAEHRGKVAETKRGEGRSTHRGSEERGSRGRHSEGDDSGRAGSTSSGHGSGSGSGGHDGESGSGRDGGRDGATSGGGDHHSGGSGTSGSGDGDRHDGGGGTSTTTRSGDRHDADATTTTTSSRGDGGETTTTTGSGDDHHGDGMRTTTTTTTTVTTTTTATTTTTPDSGGGGGTDGGGGGTGGGGGGGGDDGSSGSGGSDGGSSDLADLQPSDSSAD